MRSHVFGYCIALLLVWSSAAVFSVSAQAAGDGSATAAPPIDDAIAPSSAPDMTDGMRDILRKVGSIPCDEDVRRRMYALLFEKNRKLHDKCYADCGYQFFPQSKDKATPTQIVAAASSPACVNLFSGVILADFPECDIDYVSTRSCAEILLRIKTDIDDRRMPPTEKQFYEFYNLNRVINLLNENASLIEDAFRNSSAEISLWEMTKMMNRIYVSPDVTLDDDMTIRIRGEDDETVESSESPSAAAESRDESPSPLTDDDDSYETEEPTPTPSAVKKKMQASLAVRVGHARPLMLGSVLSLVVVVMSM